MTADTAAECSVCERWPDKNSTGQIQSGASRVEPPEAEGVEGN